MRSMPYTPAHKAQTRARIVGAALTLFSWGGFTEVSIDEIMEAATRAAASTAHSDSKDELYGEAVRRILTFEARPKPDLGGTSEQVQRFSRCRDAPPRSTT
jgi:AcrR family transcriptional regulator